MNVITKKDRKKMLYMQQQEAMRQTQTTTAPDKSNSAIKGSFKEPPNKHQTILKLKIPKKSQFTKGATAEYSPLLLKHHQDEVPEVESDNEAMRSKQQER